ncbi:lysyl-tRNA synthetase [Grosmannia clavigera kw1407]|uniref:Lysyl-tRNA synthetase n=1 Tax=Grosmannia clavigera (strain kw1407 / UAMH 11150) TaxID=655863 RepID=F0XU68_GROCL|nr:lysyl-tRNA synthetase [Grosmannia clavigera kw1407]EFW98644.1 lysyl-tRNA synthetase [Grosmannia clavigera kw1407]
MSGLGFLRPYAAQSLRPVVPTSRGRTAYLRLYQSMCSSTSSPRQKQKQQQQQQQRQYDVGCRRRRPYGTAAGEGTEQESTTELQDRSAIALRVQELREADALHYPRYEPVVARQSVPVFRATFAGVTEDGEAAESRRVELSGRVMSVQRLGAKLVFLKLLDEGEQVQVMCNLRQLADGEDEAKGSSQAVTPAAFKTAARLLQRGDHIAVTGRATRTATGELTLAADRLPRVLSPGLAPLPTRLLDGDTRAQRRHMDLLVNVDGAAAALRLRARLLRVLRRFLEAARFVEVQTPILAPLAGGAVARPFVTGMTTAGTAAGAAALSLRIAPELWLKRLVVGGLDRVFEIGPCFRNEGIDTTHNPEFTMCEFYAAYWTLPRLIAETERLMAQLAIAAEAEANAKTAPSLSIGLCAAGGPFVQLAFVPALEAALGLELPDLERPDAYALLRERLPRSDNRAVDAVGFPPGDTLAKLLDRLAGCLLEPRSAADRDGPLFITHHPACMSPLAKSLVCPLTGQRVAARAELFVDGRELANMYEEENDPAEQRRKMEQQLIAHDQDHDAMAVDENYIAALESGLPPTGGWGCGVERLVMLFSGQRRIADCLSFGTLRHVVAMSKG